MEDQSQMNIKIVPNGPIKIRGKFIFRDSSGKTAETEEVLICRCGESKNMPFCDCSHRNEK